MINDSRLITDITATTGSKPIRSAIMTLRIMYCQLISATENTPIIKRTADQCTRLVKRYKAVKNEAPSDIFPSTAPELPNKQFINIKQKENIMPPMRSRSIATKDPQHNRGRTPLHQVLLRNTNRLYP